MIKMIYEPVMGVAIPDGACMGRAKLIGIASKQPASGEMYFSTSNIFQAVRVLVKRGKIGIDDIVFEYDGVEMKMDKNARIANWQNGFIEFDEKMLEELI